MRIRTMFELVICTMLISSTIQPFELPSFFNVFGKKEKSTHKKEFNVTKKTTLNLSGITGNISVQTWEKDRVLIEIEKFSPEGQMQAIDTPIEHTTSMLTIQTKHKPIPYEPKKKGKKAKKDVSEQFTPADNKLIVNYTIIIPTYLTANIYVANGEITTDNTSGSLSLKAKHASITASNAHSIQAETEKGSITLKEIQNELFAKTDNGSISLEHIHSALAITQKGNISVENAKGSINVRSNSGHITAKHSDDDIKAETLNGSIHIENAARNVFSNAEKGNVTLKKATLDPEDSVFIQAKHNVTYYIGPKFCAHIYAKTVSGIILSNVDVTLEKMTTKLTKETWNLLKRNVKGTIGGGGGPVTIDTTSGNIEFILE